MKQNYYLASWVDGTIEDKEIIALEGEEALKTYKKILTLTDDLILPIPQSLDWEVFKEKRNQPQKGKLISFPFQMAIAASFLLLIGLGIFLNLQTTITGEGTSEWVILADGTQAQLTPGATLTYKNSFGWLNRNVNMTGEILFQVSKGKPFTVSSAQGEVEVLGTVFRVIDEDDFFEVSCSEGKVGVQFGEKRFVLERGMTVNNFTQKTTLFNSALLEQENYKYYQRVPLKYAISIIQKTYATEVIFNFKKSYYFTGLIPLINKDEALEAIATPFSFTMKKDADEKVILLEK